MIDAEEAIEIARERIEDKFGLHGYVCYVDKVVLRELASVPVYAVKLRFEKQGFLGLSKQEQIYTVYVDAARGVLAGFEKGAHEHEHASDRSAKEDRRVVRLKCKRCGSRMRMHVEDDGSVELECDECGHYEVL